MKECKICIISFSDLENDPRVRRQIDALKGSYEVTTLGLKKSHVQGIKEFIIPDNRSIFRKMRSRLTFLLSRFFKSLYNEYIKLKYPINDIMEMLSDKKFDLIIANGLEGLIITSKIARKYKSLILFDSHEYEPRMTEDKWFHRLFLNPYKDFLCKRYLDEVNVMTTVSYGIAGEFNRVYGIKSEIILNAPEYQVINLKDVDPDNIRIIHHGLANPSRNIENMIYLMPLLERRFHLTLMLVVRDVRYFKYLKNLRDKICPERIDFLKPVPFDDIIPTISHYDIELIIFRPNSFSVEYSLPNKFFEAIMAGLSLIIGPSPEMKNIIEEFNCGFISSSFEVKKIASLINTLTLEEIIEKKKASLKAATILNGEKEMDKLSKIVREILYK